MTDKIIKLKILDLDEVSHWSNKRLNQHLYVSPETADYWEAVITYERKRRAESKIKKTIDFIDGSQLSEKEASP